MPTNPSPSSTSRRSFSLHGRGLTLHRGDRPVLVDIDVTVTERSRLAVVGPNGVGKSTLLGVLAGRVEPDRGRIERAPADLTVGLLDQEAPAGGTSATVRQLVAERTGVAPAARELELASAALADVTTGDEAADGARADRYQRALDRYLALGAGDLDARLDAAAGEVGLDRPLLDADPATLSGGEAERVGLLVVMVSRFDLTLLDEPTNNLDLDGLAMLEAWVAGHSGGLVVVSHDRAFLERVATSVLEIDGHHHTAALFQGGWEAYRIEQERAAAQARTRYDNYVSERDRLRGRAQQQREWAAQGASRARRQPLDNDKNIQRFRMAQTEKLAAKARATERAAERLETVDKPWEPWRLQLSIDQASRSATVVASLERAVFRRGSFELGPLDLEIRWADRVGLVGPNGSGKSTLLAGLLGHLAPVSGRARLGPGVVVGEMGQGRNDLDPGSDRDGRTGTDADTDTDTDTDNVTVGRPRPTSRICCGWCRTGPGGRRPRSGRCWPSSGWMPMRWPARPGRCPRGSGPEPSWRCSRPAASTCWCSTSRPTTSTSRPSSSWRRRWPAMRAR